VFVFRSNKYITLFYTSEENVKGFTQTYSEWGIDVTAGKIKFLKCRENYILEKIFLNSGSGV